MLDGHFVSMYQSTLLLSVPGHAWRYVLHVPDSSLQTRLYCRTNARIQPADGGQEAEVECDGATYRLRCWRASPADQVSESMRIANELAAESQRNVRAEPPEGSARARG